MNLSLFIENLRPGFASFAIFGYPFLELLGYLGAILLTLSAVPQLIKTIQTKEVSGLSATMLWSWSLGCFLMFVYVTIHGSGLPLIVNYLFNTSVSAIILICYYKYK